MGSGFSKMKKQARAFEEQMSKMRADMQNTQIEGSSEGGLVTVMINGEKELVSIKIKPECVDPSDLEGLQDLIKSACAQAYKKADSQNQGMMPGGFPNF
jgi:DNA-binding YbaB/EbfC family protein